MTQQNLDRFKVKWFSNGFMYEVITLNVNDDYAIVRPSYGDDFTPDEEVKISDGILLQGTSLKDKNGKLIYEGDILQLYCKDFDRPGRSRPMEYEEYDEFYKVEYIASDGRLVMVSLEGKLDMELDEEMKESLTIIGNIHTHPELLKRLQINN